MLAVDLHAHTRFFHAFPGRPTPFDPVGGRLLAWLADRWGLDGVALTNHDYYYPLDVDFLTVPGIEVSTTRGHVLVVGPDPPTHTKPGGLTPTETVALAHRHGCAAILPHPFRNSTVRESGAQFDAVELNGKHGATHQRARELATELDLPLVAGSDAHYPVEVGRAYTKVDADEPTPEAVVEAIRDGRVEPVYRQHPIDSRVEQVYEVLHRAKGHR